MSAATRLCPAKSAPLSHYNKESWVVRFGGVQGLRMLILVAPGPYSLFRVGASLLLHEEDASGKTIITGANVENAAYPVGTCAERVAMGTAIHAGHKLGSFKAIGVATGTSGSIFRFLNPLLTKCRHDRLLLTLRHVSPISPRVLIPRDPHLHVQQGGQVHRENDG